MQDAANRPSCVTGIDGKPLTRADLPAPGAIHWTPYRKAQLARAVESGLLSPEEARRRYALSAEELASWQRALKAQGVPGLRATRVQIYRRTAGC